MGRLTTAAARLAVLSLAAALTGCNGNGDGGRVPTPTETAVAPVFTATPVPPTGTFTPTPEPVTNIRALHDSQSAQYDANCLKCHADVLREHSLDPLIAGAHPSMFPFVGGPDCLFCHRSVDFDNQSAANVRRNVEVEICASCHGQGGMAAPFYVRPR
jgi:hypothetical protein